MEIYEVPQIFDKAVCAFKEYTNAVESVDTSEDALTVTGRDLIEDALENARKINELFWQIEKEWIEVEGVNKIQEGKNVNISVQG